MNFKEHYFVEKFGMESIYSLPEDKEQQLFDFYALSMINPDALIDDEARMFFSEAKEKIINGLQKSFIDALYTAVATELFHTQNQSMPFYNSRYGVSLSREKAKKEIEEKFTPEEIQLVKDMRNFGLKNYDIRSDFLKKKGYTPEKLYKLAQKVFGLKWASGYGGKKWKQIADGLERLLTSKSLGNKMVAIDHAYDLQHNNDTVFNKVREFAKDGSYSWLKKALDLKAKIKEPHVYLQNISAQLYRPLAYALKQLYGKTLEDFTRQRSEERKKIVDDILKNWPADSEQRYSDYQAMYDSIEYDIPVSIFVTYDFDNNEIRNSFYARHTKPEVIKSYRNDPDIIEIKVINPEEVRTKLLEKAKEAKENKQYEYVNQIKKISKKEVRQIGKEYIIYYDPEDNYNVFSYIPRMNLAKKYQKNKVGDIIYNRYVIVAIIKPDGSRDEL